jgi:hypothetical protein
MPCLAIWRTARSIAKSRFFGQYIRNINIEKMPDWFGAGDDNA